MTDFDEDDWQDLEKPAKGEQKPDVTVRLSPFAGRHGKTAKVRASLVLRRDAAEWARANGPRFRIQIGGPNANGIRIIPDAERGQYEGTEFHGVIRLLLGVVTLWPNESRDETEAKWSVTPGGLVLMLPADFAKPGQGPAPAEQPKAAVAPARQTPSPAFPVTTAARGLENASRAAAKNVRRDVSSSLMGDPPASRSALAQRERKS